MVGSMGRFVVLCSAFLSTLWLLLSEESPYKSVARSSESSGSNALYATSDEFSWDTILPTENLIWHDCYSDHQCARLKVPLDYANPEAASAAIAMRRIHSIVPHNSTDYRGPILINPGGPGASGVDAVVTRGAYISTILGREFDVIGFDPRGISRSTPRVSFFASRAEREIYINSPAGNPHDRSLDASSDALARAWASGMIEGQLAGERDDGSLRFINTDHTARDMLRIVQAHGRDKIQYWGFSYGSVLGATFASMFPNNVERLVIDGVVDSENYFAGEWSNNLSDTDKVWASFINGCVAAGPHGCAFYSPTAAEIQENVDKIYASLRARPIPVRTTTSFGIVDYSTMRRAIFLSLYIPYARFPALAQALADLSGGNGTALFKMTERPAFECDCDPSEFRFEEVEEASDAVRCNDGKRVEASYEDFVEHYHNTSKLSSWADVWEPTRLGCLAWPEFPNDHFQGPFVANTSFPLLLVGNTADPVTPLSAAKKMSQGFARSVVLTQDSAGHTSTSAPSLCTQKHIRQYFLDGALPEPGTVCPVIGTPFPTDEFKWAAEGQEVLSLSAADRRVLEAVTGLSKMSHVRFPAGL
ncbi:TAP-like protein-domain-containing protein [Mycena galericulata]|nr:TAP-like protein-domain-containing protein [Mycena galericulata]